MELSYPVIKAMHVALISASGLLFFVRGIASLSGMRWPLARPARASSYAIDTALLAAALLLLWLLPWTVFANGWLAMKLGLLVVYVVLGYHALRPGRAITVRVILFCLALVIYGAIYTIARAHHPLGVLHGL